MSLARYGFNILKLLNRGANTLLGGSPEVPLSARAGYWQSKGYKIGIRFAGLINFMFKDKNHCKRAFEKEDDSITKYTSDPEGDFFWILLLFWIAVIVGAVVYAPRLCAAETFGPYAADLVRVIDGDTIEVDLHVYPGSMQRVSIRENGINTPEKRTKLQCEKVAGIAATLEAAHFLSGKHLVVENLRPGKYVGRMLGNVYANGGSLADHMLQTGHARPYHGEKREPWCQ